MTPVAITMQAGRRLRTRHPEDEDRLPEEMPHEL